MKYDNPKVITRISRYGTNGEKKNYTVIRRTDKKRTAIRKKILERKKNPNMTTIGPISKPHIDFTCERDVFRATIGDSCYIIPLMFWINIFGKDEYNRQRGRH